LGPSQHLAGGRGGEEGMGEEESLEGSGSRREKRLRKAKDTAGRGSRATFPATKRKKAISGDISEKVRRTHSHRKEKGV